jgi:hypothetical protein
VAAPHQRTPVRRPLPIAADTRRLRQDPLADTAGSRDRKLGPHPGNRTPPQLSGWLHPDTVAGCGGQHGGQPATALRNMAAVRASGCGRVRPACRNQHGCGLREQRSRTGSGRVRTNWQVWGGCRKDHRVHAAGWRAVGGRIPVRAADRRRQRHGHRRQPGHVCRTAAVRRAVVRKQRTVNPLMLSGSLQLSLRFLQGQPAGGRLRRPSSAGKATVRAKRYRFSGWHHAMTPNPLVTRHGLRTSAYRFSPRSSGM